MSGEADPQRHRTVLASLVVAFCVLLGACSDDSASTTAASTPTTTTPASTFSAADSSTSEPATTTGTIADEPVETAPIDDLLDAAYLTDLASGVAVSEGAFIVAIVDSDGAAVSGSSGADANGASPGVEDVFRIGSITKIFTSLATLTLVDEGLVDLDAPADSYVTRVAVEPDITVRDLLRHRSGIDNYTSVDGFFETVIAESDRVWEPEEQVNSVADRPLLFDPGSTFSYSNTNYVVLGILIEEVTGQRYHEVVRERIIDPLDLSATYLAGFEEGTEPFDPYDGSDYDYTSIATSAWSAGAMVSDAADLHSLFTALFAEEIVSSALVDELTADSFYGLGVELDRWRSGLLGHAGGIPGYFTFVRHSTRSGITAFFAATDDSADMAPAIDPVLDLLADADDEAVEAAAPPANDLLADAVVIDPSALPFSAELDTTGATADEDDVDAGCPAPATDASVWYSVTTGENMMLRVSQDGSDYSVGISALSGEPGSLDLIECRPFAFVVEVEAGVTYYLQVFDGQDDGGGNGGLLNFTVEVAP